MFNWLGNLVDSNEKVLKKLQPIVAKINELEPEYEKLGLSNANLQVADIRDKILACLFVVKERTNNLVPKIDTANTLIQSPTYTQDLKNLQLTISDSQELIKEVHDG